MSVVVLRNPYSSKNLKGSGTSLPSAIRQIDLSDFEALSKTLCDLKQSETKIIIIDGGDGTIREILSRLPEIYGDGLPLIGIRANGNTNQIARKAGVIHSLSSLETLATLGSEQHSSLSTQTIPLLRLDIEGGDQPPRRGFMSGWGAYASATRMAIEEMQTRGSGQVAIAFLKILRRTFIGAEARALRQGVSGDIKVDGQDLNDDRFFLGVASTLNGPLVAGFNPFWGSDQGPIRWTNVRAPARYLFPGALLAARGIHQQWMTRAGYCSGRTTKISLAIDGPVVLDGEFVEADQGQTITFSANETVRFISM